MVLILILILYFYIKTGSLQNYWSCSASSARFMSLSLLACEGTETEWMVPGCSLVLQWCSSDTGAPLELQCP